MASLIGEASSSSCTSIQTSRSCTYDVFLSFRGKDTREGFIGHLFAALELKGIIAFKDDRVLQKGDVIALEFPKAIEESMFAIPIISPNYAFSTWCLDELQKIVECNEKHGLGIVPVFYHVEPSNVRHQKETFREALDKHGSRFGHHSHKLDKWRQALTKVANCSGWEWKSNNNDKDEAGLVENIAQDIHKKLILSKLPCWAEKLVGIRPKVEEVCSLLTMGSKDVRFIGIWGMGGMGKTTIARAVYETIQGDFKISCFLENVREACDKNNIVQKQQELVACVNISANSFHSKYAGRRIIQNSLCNKMVLLVIDDVHEASQLEDLAGKDWFGPGSRIIITTRDKHLFEIHGIHECYEVEKLTQNDALRLFCLKAFKQDRPKEGYLDLSNEVVNYSGGLPLALDTLGSFLCGRNTIEAWQSGVKKIRSLQDRKIHDILKISFDDLDLIQKDIFLDIVCFFKGKTKDYVIDILEKCDYNPQIEIDILVERSLITLSKRGTLEMHDLIEEMGKTIVIQESPKDPGKCSRLWCGRDINLVLAKNKGTEAIKGIVLPKFLTGETCSLSVNAFSNMNQLKLLILDYVELPPCLNPLPSSLKVLHWEYYRLKSLPLSDEQYEIVDITLKASRIERLWDGEKFLEKLKILDINSWELKQMPDVSALPNLEKLKLHYCTKITEVHPSLIHHKKLLVLDLSNCCSIKTFPGKLEMSSLKELILYSCWDLVNVPEFGECMKSLSTLSLSDTAIRELPTSLTCLVGLEELFLDTCYQLNRLPETIHELKSLRTLRASSCVRLNRVPSSLRASSCVRLNRVPSSLSHAPLLSSLDISYCRLTEKDFPLDFCHFPSLMELDLSCNPFVSIPITIHRLPKLTHLMLNHCSKLETLPELPSSIRQLDARFCYSLKTSSEFNPLSTACSVFASPTDADHGLVLQMLVTGKEVPSWFVHQEDGNCVSLPLKHNFPQNQRFGIALCFQIQLFNRRYGDFGRTLVVQIGKRSITKSITKWIPGMEEGDHLYILYLSNDYFSDEIQQHNQFQLTYSHQEEVEVLSSAARWMTEQDIQDLNKSET